MLSGVVVEWSNVVVVGLCGGKTGVVVCRLVVGSVVLNRKMIL